MGVTTSKKKKEDPLKIRSVMLDLDEYLRIFILPQIPPDYKEYRDVFRETMDKAWHEMYFALLTSAGVRQRHILAMRIEMAMLETYLREVRDVCYRGKAARKLDQNSRKRFSVAADKHKDLMNILWAWTKNEDKKHSTENLASLSGLVEKEGL